jgi:serine/threonine protein kinase
MKKYDKTFNKQITNYSNKLKNFNNYSKTNSNSNVNIDIYKTIEKIIVDLNNLKKLNSIGISMQHRDLTPNNIMIDENQEVKFIDFGFAIADILFANGERFIFGHFFDEDYSTVIDDNFDIIFFVIYMVIYYASTLNKIGLFKIFKLVVEIDNNKNLIHHDKKSDLWYYSYFANINYRDQILTTMMNYLKIP